MRGLIEFSNELDALVKRYQLEADITYAEVIAALEMKKHAVMNEAADRFAGGEDACADGEDIDVA